MCCKNWYIDHRRSELDSVRECRVRVTSHMHLLIVDHLPAHIVPVCLVTRI